MNRLTPLERMFVEEFCRFAGIETASVERLAVLERSRNPVGFMTTLDPRSIPAPLNFGTVFNSPRVAVVGPEQALCGSLLFFDSQTGALDAIEGYVYGDAWPAWKPLPFGPRRSASRAGEAGSNSVSSRQVFVC